MLKNRSYEDMIGYNDLDLIKRAAMKAARETDGNIANTGFKVIYWSRGESVFLIEGPNGIMGTLEEGLGTKNKVAEAIRNNRRIACMIARELEPDLGRTFYDSLAQDNMAMIFNDMATLNVRPMVTNVHWAVGDSAFFKDERRVADLIAGTKKSCNIVGCVWGGGETPTLRGIIYPDTILLSGSATGWVNPKSKLIVPRVEPGDSIFMLPSSGIMANGLTMAREVAELLPHGWFTLLSDGKTTFGEAILTPTDLYGPIIAEMVDEGVEIHYTVNVTGHGWRKLMRLDAEMSYIVDQVPDPHEEFRIIQEAMHQTPRQMYETFNMAMGFAIYAPASSGETIIRAAKKHGLEGTREIGHIENGPRRVVISPLDLEWSAEELGVR